jgi:Zn-dependent metalloprotease
MLFGMALISALLIFGQTVSAQNEPNVIAQPFKINGKDVKEYLMEKYKLHKDDVVSTDIQQTPNGPSGKLHLRGNIKPKDVVITEDTVQGRAKAIAKAFLKEESSLFGIADIEEIREEGIFSNKGRDGEYIRINYRRYIDNLPMLEMYIYLTVGPDKEITWADAKLVPVPAELYTSVKKPTISKEEAIQIIKQDMQANGNDPEKIRILYVTKIAVSLPPHVVWAISANLEAGGGSWDYTVNAFTGEVIKKIDARIFIK